MDTAIKSDDEIDEEIRQMHAKAQKEIEELTAKKGQSEEIESKKKVVVQEEQKETPSPLLRIVPPKELRTFAQWFRDFHFAPELETINKRRGQLIPLMTAYTNLDILRTLGQMTKTLKEIPDLIQDQVDATEAMQEALLSKLDELIKIQKTPEVKIQKASEIVPQKEEDKGVRKRGNKDK